MKRRWVPVPVDDEQVTHLVIQHHHKAVPYFGGHVDGGLVMTEQVRVPPDDRLTPAIRTLIRASAGEAIGRYEASGRNPESTKDIDHAIAVVEAHFQLDKEDDNG